MIFGKICSSTILCLLYADKFCRRREMLEGLSFHFQLFILIFREQTVWNEKRLPRPLLCLWRKLLCCFGKELLRESEKLMKGMKFERCKERYKMQIQNCHVAWHGISQVKTKNFALWVCDETISALIFI